MSEQTLLASAAIADRTVFGPDAVLGGRYRLGSRLGLGGDAEVFQAVDRVLDRRVAVKIMLADGRDATRAVRFEEEARLTAVLSHPHLVPLFDAGIEGGRRFHVMRLIDGSTMARRIGQGAVGPAEVRGVGMALAGTLAHIHARGIVHRDVKPSNILLDAGGGVFLADFGIAQAADRPNPQDAGCVIGTAGYLSPEQLRGGTAGPAADVHALGMVLLEALTGHREYSGAALERAVGRLLRSPRIPDRLGARWCSALGAMTAADQADRPNAEQARELIAACGPDPGPLRRRRSSTVRTARHWRAASGTRHSQPWW